MFKHLQIKTLLLLLVLVGGVTTASAEKVTFDFSALAQTNSWANGTAYTPVTISPITLNGNGGGNNAKYYTSDKSWRMYGGGTVVIEAAEGYEVTAVTSEPTQTFTISEGKATLSCSSTIRFTKIEVEYVTVGSLTKSDFALNGASVALSFDLYNNASAQVISYTTSSTGTVTVEESDYVTTAVDQAAKTITVTPKKKTSSPVTLTVSQAADDTYSAGTATFTVSIDDTTPSPWAWVETDLSALTANDVFVIVGSHDGTYAMTNDNGTGNAPKAVAVTVADGKITSSVDNNLLWNTNGSTFYPNGETDKWLYCNTTASSSSNNNMRVGTGDRNVFVIDENKYLKTSDSHTARYVSVYNGEDWRGYVSSSTTVKFYKRVDANAPQLAATSPDEFSYDATSGAIDYTLTNATVDGVLTAISSADWLTVGMPADGRVALTFSANNSRVERTATVTLTYTYNTSETTTASVEVSQAGDANATMTYATLPFEWEGGPEADLGALDGVSSEGLGSYAESHNPYLVKFDTTGDYIQVKTDGQPGFVTVGVKMIGGANSSSITVKASADGESFIDVETLTISGNQNDILTLTTSNYFAATDRYVRLEFTKGSNVGVGPITITGCISKEVSNAGMATFVPQYAVKVPNGVQAMIVTAINEKSVTTADVTTTIPAGAPVVLKNAGTFNFPVVNYETTTSNINGNLLKVVTATEPAPDGSYVLYNGDKGVGFYEWTGAALAVGRVYLAPATKPGSRSYLSIGGDADMTGIETMYNEKCTMNNEVFDLQGRRVAQPVKGLYIVNGKKVIK